MTASAPRIPAGRTGQHLYNKRGSCCTLIDIRALGELSEGPNDLGSRKQHIPFPNMVPAIVPA